MCCASTAGTQSEKATFAGGCFWCMEPSFESLPGVINVTVGYMGGKKQDPTYQEVSTGRTGHREVVQVTFDPSQITYKQLLDVFWRQIDPTDPVGQFADKGPQYKTAIFYHNSAQKRLAEKSKRELQESGRFEKPVVTDILPASAFYRAEDYHQDYYKKCPVRYNNYKRGSGRKAFIEKEWCNKAGSSRKYEKPPEDKLKEMLTPLQYKVTQRGATEPPFKNAFWDNTKEGIYVDIVSGEPLFSSTEKFKSGTGWPSFTRPLEPENIIERKDERLFTTRTEVRSRYADSHLGHVFNDGPKPTGLRYCINSAALRFIPRETLQDAGYGKYKKLFGNDGVGE